MRPRLICLTAALTLLLEAAASADDWPMYLMDVAHSSYAASERQLSTDNVGSLQPAWRFKGQYFGGAPTIAGGVIYIGDWSGAFYAINASDGALRWQQFAGVSPPPADPNCQPAIGVTGQAVIKDGVVYVPGGDSAVYALEQNTGSQFGACLWPTRTRDHTCGPQYRLREIRFSSASLLSAIVRWFAAPLSAWISVIRRGR